MWGLGNWLTVSECVGGGRLQSLSFIWHRGHSLDERN